MSNPLAQLHQEIQQLENKIERYLESLQETWHYRIDNGKVRFDALIRAAHKTHKVNVVKYLLSARLSHIVSVPFIYGMFFPLLLLDISLLIYQQICFRLYDIPLVKRGEYFVVDRHLLSYLNAIEKFNCFYCSYGNGLIAFAREVLARTEQYWCPIKHAAKVKDSHSRYLQFSDYGDAENYRHHLESLRKALNARSKCRPE